MIQVSSWGRLFQSECDVTIINRYQLINTIQRHQKNLALGQARSYGDVCLNTRQQILKTTQLNFFKSFDEKIGVLECESGVLLKDIQNTFIPRGWMLPVTPGTQLITVGGAIANDVHGKNHHKRGNFGHHILEIKLVRSDGRILICSRQQNTDLFKATIGGVGLTGIIISAKIQLMPIHSPMLEVEYLPFLGLNEFVKINEESEQHWEYTVSWIDCLSGKNVRGIFIRANHIQDASVKMPNYQDKPKNLPNSIPISLINNLSLKVFNQFYYHFNAQKKRRKYIQHFYDFQYPLDSIENWNVLYGKKGFYQYQCVIPSKTAQIAIEQILEIIRKAQQGSFLVVLKAFGSIESEGMLSFPMQGITLALDFPNLGEKTLNLFHHLDKVVLQNHGRLYLAKDARMSHEFFIKTYPRAIEFMKFRDSSFCSDMAVRLFGEI